MDYRQAGASRHTSRTTGNASVKKTQKPGPARASRKQEAKPVWTMERHSGEGSASALETLQKLEKKRSAARPADPHKD